MAGATLLISSKNYSSWSLRGYLLARLAGLAFEEKIVDPDDPANRKELLMQSSSIRVPALMHDDVVIWDTLAIAEYLNEMFPKAGMLPADRAARARCRSISGEMHSGFSALREALPMNLRLLPAWLRGVVGGAGGYRPDHRNLARMPDDMEGAMAVRRQADDRRRDVCAGRHPVPQL